MLSRQMQRDFAGMVEDDLSGATVTSCNVNVDAAGWISVEEIILQRRDGREVAIGLDRPQPGSTRRPEIVMETHDGTGWRAMTVQDDYGEELADSLAVWRP